ncbi:MAG: CxxC motif-containing protein (DUF1111 family) [Sulfurimonas sp.]|jgi:CxxC motif-containing protein (DUF1111 family)|uniref:di-heme oxidoreductase family protein n=1 Tax=Sulfurimonas sp. TaxID=2022749 RepID=UPI0039E57950
MHKVTHFIIPAIFLLAGCSFDTKSKIIIKEPMGVQFTKDTSKNAFSKSIDFKSNDSIDMHILGKSFFTIPWVEAPAATTARDGLGPLFSANTCIHCHPKNGAGIATDKNDKITRSLVMRLSIPHGSDEVKMKNGFIPEPTYGGQLSVNGTSNTPFESSVNLTYKKTIGKYADGSTYELQNPTYTLSNLQYGPLHKDINIAPRIGLALIGLGALESIDEKDILKNEDIEDKDDDGISGKANWVYNPETNSTELGRFTWKGAAATVLHQTANAAHNDMGLSNPLFPKHNCTDAQKECKKASKGKHDFDLPQNRLNAIAYYLKTLKIPKQRIGKNFFKGEAIFNELGCVKCHTQSFKIADSQTIKPYSDLLLHDMGEGLSDGHTMFKANANEFRTPPLWGIGLYKKMSSKVSLLHDGRARNIEEAILWHGGEAKETRELFKKLSKKDRNYLIEFLNSI